MLPSIMQSVDITIAAVALPKIQGALSATQDEIAWVLSSYLLAVAVVTPATGWLAARLGRRRLFLMTVAGFTTVSMLSGSATSLPELVFYRFLQGALGAGLVPLSQAVVLDANPPREHARAMGIWGIGIMVGPILGPTLGGFLAEYVGWRWVFFINVPIGLAAFAILAIFVPPDAGRREVRFDLFGYATLAIGLAALQLMLERGERLGWFGAPQVVMLAAVAALGLYLFLAHSLTTKAPFLDMKLFRNRNFAVGLVFAYVSHVGLYATIALLPPLFQHVLGYPPLDAGLLFVPRAAGTLVGMIVVTRLAKRGDPRMMITLGLLVAAFGLWQMSGFTTEVGAWPLVWTGFLLGVGLGLVFTPASVVALSMVPAASRTEASGIYAVVRSIGASMGIAVFVTIFVRTAQEARSRLVENITPFGGHGGAPLLPDAWKPETAGGVQALSEVIDLQAQMLAYNTNFLLLAVFTAALIPIVLLVRHPAQPAVPSPAERAAD